MNDAERLAIAMRAKVGLLWIQSPEEIRCEKQAIEVASSLGYKVWTWTATQGVRDVENPQLVRVETRDPATALETLLKADGRVVGIFFDLGSWLNDPLTLRTAKDVHRALTRLDRDKAKQVIVVDQSPPPSGLVGTTVIEWAMPDRQTLEQVLDAFCEWAPEKAVAKVRENDNRNKIVGALQGLTTEAAASALSKSLASQGTFDPALISVEKERLVRGSGLEWYEPDPRGLDGVGGLDALKRWLVERRSGFTAAAREYGLPAPKGVVLLGIPGGGKSLTAKCVAAAWNLPLLRMDVGALFGKFVGESESKIRQALKTAEAVAPCILWLDEIEKAFSGGGGETDGGTSQRVFGTFLTWMQERKEGVFVIATSNDISKLPPEFLRAGRWDDIWFVDLPTESEREQIVEVMKRRFKNCGAIDARAIAAETSKNTGSEIEQAFIESMFTAFSDGGREVRTEDVTEAIKNRIPLAVTMDKKIEDLRAWAKGRARMASTGGAERMQQGQRAIE